MLGGYEFQRNGLLGVWMGRCYDTQRTWRDCRAILFDAAGDSDCWRRKYGDTREFFGPETHSTKLIQRSLAQSHLLHTHHLLCARSNWLRASESRSDTVHDVHLRYHRPLLHRLDSQAWTRPRSLPIRICSYLR